MIGCGQADPHLPTHLLNLDNTTNMLFLREVFVKGEP